eukprot:EG_transcript_12060
MASPSSIEPTALAAPDVSLSDRELPSSRAAAKPAVPPQAAASNGGYSQPALRRDARPLRRASHGSWDGRLLEFYRRMFGDAADAALVRHTVRLGLQGLCRGAEADLWLTLAPPTPTGRSGRKAAPPPSAHPVAPLALADALLATFEEPERFAAVQPLLAEHLGVPFRHCTAARVRWYASRAGLQDLLMGLDRDVLLERAEQILQRVQGPAHRLRQALKVVRRRAEMALNRDLVAAAPHWLDLPLADDVHTTGLVRRSTHRLFRCGDTVFRPRTFLSHFPPAWEGCPATPPDLRADAVVSVLVDFVFPSPEELVQKVQLSAFAVTSAVDLRSVPGPQLNHALHLLALDNATAEQMGRYLSQTTGLEQPVGCKDVHFRSHERMLVDSADDVVESDEEREVTLLPTKRRKCL